MYKRIPRQEELRLRRVIGGNIKKARISMGLSLDDVARELDYPKSKLSEIENGDKEAGAILLGMLAELYLVSAAYFYIVNVIYFSYKAASRRQYTQYGKASQRRMRNKAY